MCISISISNLLGLNNIYTPMFYVYSCCCFCSYFFLMLVTHTFYVYICNTFSKGRIYQNDTNNHFSKPNKNSNIMNITEDQC